HRMRAVALDVANAAVLEMHANAAAARAHVAGRRFYLVRAGLCVTLRARLQSVGAVSRSARSAKSRGEPPCWHRAKSIKEVRSLYPAAWGFNGYCGARRRRAWRLRRAYCGVFPETSVIRWGRIPPDTAATACADEPAPEGGNRASQTISP